MPNQQDRKKKGGQNKSKKTQRMRASVAKRKAGGTSTPFDKRTDKGSLLKFVPGGADEKHSNYSRGRRSR